MKIVNIVIIASLLTVYAEAPRFIGPAYLYDGSTSIDVGSYGAPNIFDWNGDCKKDIVVGQFSSGYIRFYPNIDSDADPQFNGYQFLNASGVQITLPGEI